jgi:hypothetical protein
MIKIISTISSLVLLCAAQAQNVGIGIATPQRAKLEVNGVAGTGSTTALFSAPAGGGISIQSYWPTIAFNQYRDASGTKYISDGFAAVQYLDMQAGGLFFDVYPYFGFANTFTPNQRRTLALYSNGNVGIGSATHNSTLTVSRNTSSESTACLFGTTHNSFFNWGVNEDTYIRAGRNSGIVYINDIPGSKVILSGLIGINTATPGTTLEIRQLGRKGLTLVDPEYFNYWEFRTNADPSSANMFMFYNGSLKGYFQGSDGAHVHTSDMRLKTNVQQLAPTLDKIMQLQPVEYEMKNNNPDHKRTIGFIAQDVKRIFPEVVNVVQDTTTGHTGISDLHTMNYSSFGVLAIKAIQEQQNLILAQQVKIDELTRTVDGLYRQLYKKD